MVTIHPIIHVHDTSHPAESLAQTLRSSRRLAQRVLNAPGILRHIDIALALRSPTLARGVKLHYMRTGGVR